MAVKVIPIGSIRLDGDTQPRVAIDQDVVQEYSEAMKAGQEFPPIELYYDGANYWLVDGFHRFHAARKIGRTELNAEVKTGMQADAQWASLATNDEHGLRRSNADKAKAVTKALRLKPAMSDGAIAAHVKVSPEMVRKHRAALTAEAPKSGPNRWDVTARTGRDGKTYNAAKIKARTPNHPSQCPSSGKVMMPL